MTSKNCPSCGTVMRVLWRFDDFFCPNDCDRKKQEAAWYTMAPKNLPVGFILIGVQLLTDLEAAKIAAAKGYSLYKVCLIDEATKIGYLHKGNDTWDLYGCSQVCVLEKVWDNF